MGNGASVSDFIIHIQDIALVIFAGLMGLGWYCDEAKGRKMRRKYAKTYIIGLILSGFVLFATLLTRWLYAIIELL